jgi:hypothetical protein
VYRSDPGAPLRPPRLDGFFPFERISRYRGLPISALVSFKHVHCFLCTPLVRRDGAAETFAATVDWLAGESGAAIVELRSIGAEGRVHQLLVEQLHARRRPFWVGDWSIRALFEPGEDAESYLRGAISGLALKEVRRKEKRLRDRGRLVWRELEPGEDAAPWLRAFLELEASGWKGRGRSALACREAEREFFVSAATAAHDVGQLMLLGLFLDDRPLALKCNFLAGAGGVRVQDRLRRGVSRVFAGLPAGGRARAAPASTPRDPVGGFVRRRPARHDQSALAGPAHDGHRPLRHRPGPGRAAGVADAAAAVGPAQADVGPAQADAAIPAGLGRRDPVRREHVMSPISTESSPPLGIDPARFSARFDRQPFIVRHRLSDHPLFALPRLIELARTLPEDRVEYNAGDVPVSLDPARTPRTGLSIDETIRRIEECRSWMVFKNVERDPDYRALLDACLDQVREHSEPIEPGMDRREGFIFVSSPDSVTPYHMDRSTTSSCRFADASGSACSTGTTARSSPSSSWRSSTRAAIATWPSTT